MLPDGLNLLDLFGVHVRLVEQERLDQEVAVVDVQRVGRRAGYLKY